MFWFRLFVRYFDFLDTFDILESLNIEISMLFSVLLNESSYLKELFLFLISLLVFIYFEVLGSKFKFRMVSRVSFMDVWAGVCYN